MSRRAAQIEDEERRRALLMGPFGLGRPLRGLAPERHYLPFNGTSSDWANAAAAAAGVKGTSGWSLFVKLASRPSAGAPKIIAGVQTAEAFPANLSDHIFSSVGGAGRVYAEGHRSVPSEGIQYSFSGGADTTNGEQVIVLARQDGVAARLIVAKAGATLINVNTAFTAPEQTRATVNHVVVGAYADGALANPSAFCDMQLIAIGLVRDLITEAEAQAYSLVRDARPVWGARLWDYWPMSQAVAASVPNLGSGTVVPLTLVGPVASELVAL